MSVYTLSPSQTKEAIQVALVADIPVLVSGKAGIGKSTIVKQLAKENNLELIDIRLSQLSKFDLLGYPDINSNPDKSFYKPLDIFPTENDTIPNGKDGYLIFLNISGLH